MKLFRTAIIVAAVLACAGAAYWYFEMRGKRKKEEKAQEEALLFEKTEAGVEKIVILNEGKEIAMERHVSENADPAAQEEYLSLIHI